MLKQFQIAFIGISILNEDYCREDIHLTILGFRTRRLFKTKIILSIKYYYIVIWGAPPKSSLSVLDVIQKLTICLFDKPQLANIFHLSHGGAKYDTYTYFVVVSVETVPKKLLTWSRNQQLLVATFAHLQ